MLGTSRCVLGVSYSLYITIPAASVVHELLLCCASSFLFEEQRYSLLSWGGHDHTHSHVSHQADGCLFCTCQCLVPHSSLKINTQISTEIVPPTPHTRTPPCSCSHIPQQSVSLRLSSADRNSFVCALMPTTLQTLAVMGLAASRVLHPVCLKTIGAGLL